MNEGILLLVLFFVLLFLKVPIGVSMLGASILAVFAFDLGPMTLVSGPLFNALFSYTILAMPFYIFAGNLMTRGGIAKKLCDMVGTIFSRFTGGLGMVTVVASAFFAAISGSASATTASIGGMMVPEMKKQGYKEEFGLAIAAAGGVIGPIIPPSVIFVIYGVATNTSVGDLFVAGILPGILLAAILCVTVYLLSKRAGLKLQAEKFSIFAFLKSVWTAKYAILMPIIILGGIYGGVFTPTEAGAVACVYAIIIALFVEKTFTVKELFHCACDSAIASAALMIVCAAATAFGRVMTIMEVPQMLTDAIMSISTSKAMVLILINLMLFLIGCVMESGAAIIILAPLLVPVVAAYNIDPIHFGVMLCVNTSIGAITPPVGTCLFAASIIGGTSYEKICKAIIPFVLAEVICLVIITVFPPLSTCLLGIQG